MTYEAFKLCVLYLATQPEQGMPNVLASIRKAMTDAGHRATADEILSIAYADYCLTHGIIE